MLRMLPGSALGMVGLGIGVYIHSIERTESDIFYFIIPLLNWI